MTMEMGIREYARHRGCSPSTVMKHLKKGTIALNENGKIDAQQADQAWASLVNPGQGVPVERQGAYRQQVDSLASQQEQPLHFAQLRAKREAVKLALDQLTLLEKRGKLVDKEAYAKEIFAASRAVRDGLLNLPDKLCHELAAQTDAVVIRDMLANSIRDALMDWVGRHGIS